MLMMVGVTDLVLGEFTSEFRKMLCDIIKKAFLCSPAAENLLEYINDLGPIIHEIKCAGDQLSEDRRRQLDNLSKTLQEGHKLATQVLESSRWNVYRNLQLSRRMEQVEKKVAKFMRGGLLQAHVLADVHQLRSETAKKLDQIEGTARRMERRVGSMKIGAGEDGWWFEEAIRRMEDEKASEGSLVNLGVGLELGKRKIKEMIIGREDLGVVGISGIGGSGKTTLAREICRDGEVLGYYGDRVRFLTVSQSPNLEQLKVEIWGWIGMTASSWKTPTRLLILDDVWSLSVLEQLIPRTRIPGCKILVVSRFKFPSIVNCSYELELLGEDEAISLFCHYAFGSTSMPSGANEKLIKQLVEECKGLPLALKVIGASLRDQPEVCWVAAKKRLVKAEPISESHETHLLNRMKLSIDCLKDKVKECFLDLGSFPEDKKIPLDILLNIWVELHSIDEEEAFAILLELSEKNLINLVKSSRAGDMYGSYYDISVSQHDVLRDLALYLSSQENINQRKRLLMPKREGEVPREWEKNMDQPFSAQIVSLHTDGMKEMDWVKMEFPRAEVLILNFTSPEYFLPPFIANMPRLRALILINYSTKTAQLHNISVLANLTRLKSLWFEKLTIPQLPNTIPPFKSLRKISLILCDMNNTLDDQPNLDLPRLFPCLSELTMDHCIKMTGLPSSVCKLRTLKSLSITNCDTIQELPTDLGKLSSLEILRVYACPNLKELPSGIGSLLELKYIDISQCVNLRCLPDEIGVCTSLEKIDMRECPKLKNLPKTVMGLNALRHVICDEDISWQWKDLEKDISGVRVQVAEECFDLEWLDE